MVFLVISFSYICSLIMCFETYINPMDVAYNQWKTYIMQTWGDPKRFKSWTRAPFQ